jgi:hypothetical protein
MVATTTHVEPATIHFASSFVRIASEKAVSPQNSIWYLDTAHDRKLIPINSLRSTTSTVQYLFPTFSEYVVAFTEKKRNGTVPDAELARIEDRAAVCAKECLNLDPSNRQLIETLLRGDTEDDDLKGFNNATFRSKAGL